MGHVVDIGKPVNYTGGLEFSSLTYTVTKRLKDENGKWLSQEVDLLHQITGYAPKGCITAVMGPSGAGKSTLLDGLAGRIASGSLRGKVSMGGLDLSPSFIKRSAAYIMQDDRLFPMLTVYETFMFAADFRLGSLSNTEKQERVERLIEQLGLSSTRNTYIGDEGTRGVSGGERRRVSIGVDIIHGPSLLFLDEPTSGLDSTSAHSVIEKVHDIARAGSTVILTIHQPSHRIQLLLDHLIILARGQLMYQGAPNDVSHHLVRMGRKVPKNESPIEHLIDVIQEYDQSEFGVEAIAAFALTGMKPPPIGAAEHEMSSSTVPPSPARTAHRAKYQAVEAHGRDKSSKRLRLQTGAQDDTDFDHSVRSASRSGVLQSIGFSPARRNDHRSSSVMGSSPGCYVYSSEIVQNTPTPHSSDYTVNENDYLTPYDFADDTNHSAHDLGPKFANSFFTETWILMRRNFINIMRTPELFLSRLVVLTAMGIMMATMFLRPKENLQGITNRLSFFIFTCTLLFFSSNDAVPAFIQERFVFIRETSHNKYRASSYTIAGLVTYLPFLALQAAVYAVIVWFALSLRGPFIYFLVVLFMSLLSTNSFVIFVSSVVPNYILGYAAVIAFTALFFLFCGYFLDTNDMPSYWKWMNYVSTMTYPYEGLLMNQYQTDESFGKDPLGRDVTGFGILKSLNISQDSNKKWENVCVMLGWAVFYRVLFYIALRFFSKNQRK
ncbi:ABC transporter G family member 19 [Capsicum annuum]|uniref:ABC transporter G family member STR2 n=1 Tax=Capsicum annuum TaxID=4072 RepID=A0A1U8GIY7_CAPAN|nr:ABC transporter G family member STR2 [Capsicum annuum]KAF3623170.1 ABC transporter G family member 19 [Capsicum annuum]KAF3673499.1 ABC transporter G family member 19 [Capsicum annuum]PHT85155.1 ABC transporter G family member 19 [Capsicum annuum]